MDLRICRAEPSDLPAVKEMYAALVARMDREGWSVWDETYPRDFVGKDIEQGQLYLLLEGDRLAGAFALPAHDNGEGDVPWEDPSAPARYLYRFGVAVEYGGRGLGRLALERIGELARGLGPAICACMWPTKTCLPWACTKRRALPSCLGSLESFCWTEPDCSSMPLRNGCEKGDGAHKTAGLGSGSCPGCH